jgi:general secretion pathway protein D
MAAPMSVKWDPAIFRLSTVLRGTLLDSGTDPAIFTQNTRNDTGEVSITLHRTPGSTGVSGSGPLVTLVFQAVGKGQGTISVTEVGLRDSKQQPIATDLPSATVIVE